MTLRPLAGMSFGAKLQIEPALDFRHPTTNLPDALTPRMAQAVHAAFNDPMSRFILGNTRDEIVITAKRVYHPKMVEPHGVQMTVAMADVPGHDTVANTRTYIFNPFAASEPGAPDTLPGMRITRDQVWERIVTLDELAQRLMPF